MLEAEKTFECSNHKCRYRFTVRSDIEQGGVLEIPVSLSKGYQRCTTVVALLVMTYVKDQSSF